MDAKRFGAVALVLALGACGKKDKPAPAPAAGSATAVVADAAPPAYAGPPAGSIALREPATAESAHVGLTYAYAAWLANPRDPTLYAKDFGGRDIPAGRTELVGFADWIKELPPPPTHAPTFETWLDPGTQITIDEGRVMSSYDHQRGRELMWRREDGRWHLYKDTVTAELPTEELKDATVLGKTVTVRFRTEGTFSWLVLQNPTGAQIVIDLAPGGDRAIAQRGDALTLGGTPIAKLAPGVALTFARDDESNPATPPR